MTFHPMALRGLMPAIALAGACAVGSAAAATPPSSAAPKAAKSAAAKPSAAKPSAAKAAPRSSGKKAPAKPVEVPLADATPEQMQAAEQVFYGSYDCEFKQTVDIEKHAKHPAYVSVRNGKHVWTMKPVLSSTGAVRLEDVKGETLMVQIASKSMLLNVKSAQRIVDDCVSSRQRELIEEARTARANGAAAGQAAPAALLQVPGAPDALPAATSAPAAASGAASATN